MEGNKDNFKVDEALYPPVGAVPHWFSNFDRITELSDSIGQYAKFIRDNWGSLTTKAREAFMKYISMWSKEIQLLSNNSINLNREYEHTQIINLLDTRVE